MLQKLCTVIPKECQSKKLLIIKIFQNTSNKVAIATIVNRDIL